AKDNIPTMTQPASVSAPPRQTTKLSCTASGSVSYIVWIQQKPGQAPRFVHCDTCSSKGQGIPDRFTASRSGTTGYLTITGTESEDEAAYYCAAWFSSMWHSAKV
uniref:Ig-like domain-containing protein n=1 Tax=Podarcis muralis TaxID=64176 RepID=A0A670K288_PODMU